MARPGDIDDDVHAEVRVYSAIKRLEIPKAYERLLQMGLTLDEDMYEDTHDKLDKFSEDNDINRVEATRLLLDSILEEDGSLSQGTVIKNVSIEQLSSKDD